MIKEIKSKWVSEKYGVIVTEEKEVIRISDLAMLKKEWSTHRTVYRAKGERTNIGEKSLSKSLIKKELILQEYCPF
jgi:hypothetical protein